MAAGNDLLIVVQVDGRPALAALSQVEGAAGRVTGAVTQLDAGFRQLQGGLVVPRSTADELDRIATSARNIPTVPARIVPAGAVDPSVAPGLQQVAGGAGAAQQAVFGLAATLDDAQQFQYGFSQGMRATTNNLQPLIQSMSMMQVQAASTGSTLASTVGAALSGPAGILVGLTVIAAIAPIVAKALDDAFTTAAERIDEAKEKATSLFDELVQFGGEFDISIKIDTVAEAERALIDLSARQAAVQDQLDRYSVAAGYAIDRQRNLMAGVLTATGRQISNEVDRLKAQMAGLDAQADAIDARLATLRDQRAFLGPYRTGSSAAEDDATKAAERVQQAADRARVRAQQKAGRDAATAARRVQREAVAAQRRTNTELNRLNEARERLAVDLHVELTREGSDRALLVSRNEYAERLKIAGHNAALVQQVQIAYARETARITEADLRAREERLLAAIEQVQQAREAAALADGHTSEEVAAARVARIRDEADATAELFAMRAREENNAIVDAAELARVIRFGMFEEADRLAVLSAETPVLKDVLDLVLARIAAENEGVTAARARRIESDAARRAEDQSQAERDARRARAAARIANPGAADDPAGDAVAHLDRLRASLASLDEEIAAATNTGVASAASIAQAVADAETGAVSIIVDGQTYTGDAIRALAEERKKLATDVANAEVDADDAKADKVVKNYERQADAARRLASDALDTIEDAFKRQRRYTRLDIEVGRDKYAQEEKDLRDSLRNREISQREFGLQMRQLAQERGQFETEVAQDTASTLAVISIGLAATLRETAISGLKAALVEAAGDQILKVIKSVPFPLNIVVAGGAALAVLGMEQIIRSAAGFAHGGPVYGPGTGTSDEVLAWLSNGEHIITAQAAQGQHGALALLNAQMEAGLDLEQLLRMMMQSGRFATGGPFLTPRPTPSRPVLSSSTVGPAGLDLSPVVAELQQSRRETAALVAQVSRLAVPRVVTDPEARRIERRRQREVRTKRS